MKNYRPLLFEDVDLQIGDLRVTCLRLNRHTPEARPDPHQHDHSQLLIYLSGSGRQVIDGVGSTARPGTVIYVAPGQVHAFERQRQRRPLCLVIDLKLNGTRKIRTPISQLSVTELNQIRSRLSSLFGYGRKSTEAMMLRLGAVILDVLDPVMATLGWFGGGRLPQRRLTITRRVERELRAADVESKSLPQIARRVGYQHDHLNRLLKTECGLTLGQLRSKLRLERAQKLLGDGDLSISEVGEQIGLLDNNYFARWFRQQTGRTPSAWRSGRGG